jgi:hypothetical protein
MEANPSWRPGSSGPLGSGNPKGPDWPFGADGVHRGSGMSGPCESKAATQLQKKCLCEQSKTKAATRVAEKNARASAYLARSNKICKLVLFCKRSHIERSIL